MLALRGGTTTTVEPPLPEHPRRLSPLSYPAASNSCFLRITDALASCLMSGAMINAELLYTLTQAGGTYKGLSVHHLPRQAGRATGAKLSVILRVPRTVLISNPVNQCTTVVIRIWYHTHTSGGEKNSRGCTRHRCFTHHEDETLEHSHVFPMENQ